MIFLLEKESVKVYQQKEIQTVSKRLFEQQEEDFNGICFLNLVDFDMLYGHRNDVSGYAKAVTEFDNALETFMKNMRDEDILIITADHGCDPGFKGTDHTREYTPMLMYGNWFRKESILVQEAALEILDRQSLIF